MYGLSTFVCIRATTLTLVAYGAFDSSCVHGITGDRFSLGTLNSDDLAVADEFPITTGAIEHPNDAGNVTGRIATISFARLLTPKVSIGFDTGFTRRDWGSMRRPGVAGSGVVLKSRPYEGDLNETLTAGSLIYRLSHIGAKRLGANISTTIASGFYIGQGFGTLPDAQFWLRPFATIAGVSVAVPTSKTSDSLSYDPVT